jgi:hypothetical protein
MKAGSNIEHITEADDNLYADIGFGPEEAARFQAEADARYKQLANPLLNIGSSKNLMGKIGDFP